MLTCRARGIEPLGWLRYALTELPQRTVDTGLTICCRSTSLRRPTRNSEGNGSRVEFEKDGIIASFHRPHPDKEAKRYQVRDAREFLMQIGVTP